MGPAVHTYIPLARLWLLQVSAKPNWPFGLIRCFLSVTDTHISYFLHAGEIKVGGGQESGDKPPWRLQGPPDLQKPMPEQRCFLPMLTFSSPTK